MTSDAAARAEVLDALREEIARERRRTRDFPGTVEIERERRVEAETLREVLEAINRQARLEETIDEVLKQLARIVAMDSCSLACSRTEQDRFRIIAGRGFADTAEIGRRLPRRAHGRDPARTAGRVAIARRARGRALRGDRRAPRTIRSWAGIPLLVEGDVIGILCLDRHRVEPFDEEDLHRAKAVAFSAAAAIRKAQLLEQVRRYAALMERLVEVDQAVFADKHPDDVAHLILEGALRIGAYRAGLLVLAGTAGPHVAAAAGAFDGLAGRPAPVALIVRETSRVPAAQVTAGLGRLRARSRRTAAWSRSPRARCTWARWSSSIPTARRPTTG